MIRSTFSRYPESTSANSKNELVYGSFQTFSRSNYTQRLYFNPKTEKISLPEAHKIVSGAELHYCINKLPQNLVTEY